MRYAIGDIHGGPKTLRALLDKINLRHSDHLYLMGDYIDRGPDSKGVLDIILQLIDSGYDVHPLRGNHEDMLIRNISGDHDDYSEYWPRLWGCETLKSFGVESVSNLKTRYITLLDSLPCCREDGKFIFVHAGLDMSMADPLTQTSTAQMLWGDAAFINSRPCADRIIVSGHKIRSVNQIEQSLTSHHIQIDNGAFYQDEPPHVGNLVALNLYLMQLTFQPWLDDEATEPKTVYDMNFQQGQETAPLIKESLIMNLITDETKASRLARVFMDDIGQYYPNLVEKGIKEHTIFELLHDHIEESRTEFNRRVTPDIAASKIFDYAIVDVLIKRAYKYKANKP